MPVISGGGGGGSSADVTAECTLEANGPVDVGTGRVLWDAIYDFSQSAVLAIPANMGLLLSADTTAVTANEAGIWVFKLVMNPVADPTAQVRVLLEIPDYSGGPLIMNMDVSGTPPLEWCISWPCAIAVGGRVRVIPFEAGATAPGYAPWSYGTLGITRVA